MKAILDGPVAADPGGQLGRFDLVGSEAGDCVHRLGSRVRVRMGRTWQPECPVGLADLRYLRVSFWDSTGGPMPAS